MITVEKATAVIQSTQRDFGVETITLADSVGRVLRENVHADRDFPPFDRVTMDGIAIDYQQFASGRRTFSIAATAAAGAPQTWLKDKTQAIEVMTGAMLPQGADTIIRYEDVTIEDGVATIQVDDIQQGQSIHPQGSDRKRGSKLIESGTRLSAAEIGVAATVGMIKLKVSGLPKIAIISTGDELVEIHETPLPHQIRQSNSYQLQAALRQQGIAAMRIHLPDKYETILKSLEQLLAENDILIISGGVSKGKFDFLPKALQALQVREHFHRVSQRPGKPFWFGSTVEGKVVFALPGNPVSAFVGLHRYVMPWIVGSLQQTPLPVTLARLDTSIDFRPDLTYFPAVKCRYDENGQLLATPFLGNTSGDLANLLAADGFLELPKGKERYEAGEVYRLFWFR
ncbi:MAG: molybdopterin molybdotransferase MoeA [Bacteroidota bacterium]